jgi:cytoskeletal protein CcmA (bactofilin family)
LKEVAVPLTLSNPRIARAPTDPSGGGDSGGGPRVQRPLVPGIPSRRVDPSGVVTQQPRHQRPNQQPDSRQTVAEEGELVVGQGITVKGALRNCRRLVVHGTVQATIPAQALEVGPDGVVEGTCEVGEATVAGRFDGDLLVDGALTVAPGGVLRGRVRYRTLTVESGGQISAEIDHIDSAPLSAADPAHDAPAASAADADPEAVPDAAPDTAAPDTAAPDTAAAEAAPGVPPAFGGLADLTGGVETGAKPAADAGSPDAAAADREAAPGDDGDQDAERFYRSLARTSARA